MFAAAAPSSLSRALQLISGVRRMQGAMVRRLESTTFYASLVAPFALWWLVLGALFLWSGTLDFQRPLSSSERVLVSVSSWLVRGAPFAVVAGGLAAPVAILVAPLLVRAPRAPSDKGMVPWLVVLFASWALLLTLLRADTGHIFEMVVFWSIAASYGLVITAAYHAQSAISRACRTAIPAGAVIVVAICGYALAPALGLCAALLPVIERWRAMRLGGTVEQGDAADKARRTFL